MVSLLWADGGNSRGFATTKANALMAAICLYRAKMEVQNVES